MFPLLLMIKSKKRQTKTKEVVYGDITSRDNAVAPSCDIYMSGAPCPAFSAAGKGGGLSDPRGSVLIHSVSYVVKKRPRIALFENVKGLVNKRNRRVLEALVEVLQAAGYKCKAKVLDTCTHGGIPHHRPRVYLVAILKNRLKKPFIWPTSIACSDLKKFLVTNVTQETKVSPSCEANIAKAWETAKKRYEEADYDKGLLVCDAQAGKGFLSVMLNLSPCLTKARGGSHGHYIMPLKRWMNVWEIASVQGWPKPLIDDLLQNFSKSTIGAALGDGFSVSLVMRIFPRALVAGGMIPSCEDKWEKSPPPGHLPDAVYSMTGRTHERKAVWA